MEDHSVVPTLPRDDAIATAAPIAAGRHIFTIIVLVMVFLIGVPGNCLILRVYWTKTHKTSTHIFIMTLACADLATCLLRLHRILEEVFKMVGDQVPGISVLIAWSLTTSSLTVSVLITALIAADRYDCVCRARNRFFTKKRAQVAVMITLACTFVVNIPAFYMTLSNDSFNAFAKIVVFAFQLLFFVAALVMIVICYQLVYKTIRKHVKIGVHSHHTDKLNVGGQVGGRPFRDAPGTSASVAVLSTTTHNVPLKGTSSTRSTDACSAIPGSSTGTGVRGEQPREVKSVILQRKTTRMLFLTSVVFILTYVPYWISVAVDFAFLGGAPVDPMVRQILKTLHVILFANNAVNPFIYGMANRRFRQDCKEVLKKIKNSLIYREQ